MGHSGDVKDKKEGKFQQDVSHTTASKDCYHVFSGGNCSQVLEDANW